MWSSIQSQAELLRSLYRLGVIDYDTLDKLLDELTIRGFRHDFPDRFDKFNR